jgi:hypothetical protein
LQSSPWSKNSLLGLGLASDRESLENLRRFQRFSARMGQGMPDFMILDSDFGQKEWQSVLAAGMFSNQWEVQSRDLYIRPQ